MASSWLGQDGVDGSPALGRQNGFHLAGHFGIAFQQLHRGPFGGVRGGDVACHLLDDFIQGFLVVAAYLGQVRKERPLSGQDALDFLQQGL